MLILRNLAYYLVFYGISTLYVILAGVLLPLGRPAAITMAKAWARLHRRCVSFFLGIHVRIEGQVPTAPAIVAAKHESFFETTELILLLDAPVAVFKQELLRVPVWGWAALAYGVIPIVRERGASALRAMLGTARALAGGGRIILIFPEGTRVEHGAAPPIKPGVSGLYANLDLPVIPLAVDSGRLWPRNSWIKKPGTITLRFGPPIPPGLTRMAFQKAVHAAINALHSSDIAPSHITQEPR